MTDEELDRARVDHALAEHRKQLADFGNGAESVPLIAARLGREGWTPPDPLVEEIEAVVAEHESAVHLHVSDVGRRLVRKALERGIEIGKDER